MTQKSKNNRKRKQLFSQIKNKVYATKTNVKDTFLYVLFTTQVYLVYRSLNNINQKLFHQDQQIIILEKRLNENSSSSNRWLLIVKNNLAVLVPAAAYITKQIWESKEQHEQLKF